MSPLEKFFASLKRLLESRPRPPAESIGHPSADRPPPLDAEPSRVEPAPSREPASPDVIPTLEGASEVRALLESVTETPVSDSVSDAQDPPTDPDPAPTLAPAFTETFPPAPKEDAVDAPGAALDRVGDSLILTLATPAATFTVAKSSATLGRGQENTIRLDDLSVSRRHARIAYRQGGYWLSDFGSMGGTWIDGTRLNAPRRIAAGEVIDIGLCRLTVSFAADAVPAETKKTANKPRSEMAGQGRRRR